MPQQDVGISPLGETESPNPKGHISHRVFGRSECLDEKGINPLGALSHSILEMFHWQKILQRERLNNGFF